jgi:hypothetical protein
MKGRRPSKDGFARGSTLSWTPSGIAQNSANRIRRDTSLVRILAFCAPELVSPLLSVKFFTSLKWKDKFTELAAQFDVHKTNLQFDLQMYVGIAVAKSNTTLATVHQNVSEMMTFVFEKMRSPEERQFAALVTSMGGTDNILANDALLRDVLDKFKPTSDMRDSDDADLTPSSLRKEIAKDPDEVVEEDAKVFDQKFSAVLTQIEEAEQAVPSEGDHGMAIVQGDLHEQMVDRVGLPTS